MGTIAPSKTTAIDGKSSAVHEDVFQVVLFNDDVNTCEYVVGCLMLVFGHSVDLAVKIMREAHGRGRAIAEVEAESLARKHAAELGQAGLTAAVEKI